MLGKLMKFFARCTTSLSTKAGAMYNPFIVLSGHQVISLLILFSCCCFLVDSSPQREKDRITKLPGQPHVTFDQYAGYITVNRRAGRALFYWFTEAQTNPSEKPLILWLSGGPGVASVGVGAITMAPLLIKRDMKLHRNKHSWNAVANLLFLDSPVNTGFSYSNTTYVKDDRTTTRDSYTFLRRWFKRFPMYRTREFYMVGQSYAGRFIPNLADHILTRNIGKPKHDQINLKGIMLGNPSLDYEMDKKGMIDFAWYHGLLSDKYYSPLCKFRKWKDGDNCCKALSEYRQLQSVLDIHNLGSHICQRQAPKRISKFDMPHAGVDPCFKIYLTEYFRRNDVQRELHANVTQIHHPWSIYNNKVHHGYLCGPNSMIPLLARLTRFKIRIWIYSGEMDIRIPIVSTKYSLKMLEKYGFQIRNDWTPWYHRKEIGGWITEYDSLITFITVRYAGHGVPLDAPKQMLQIVRAFLTGGRMTTRP